MIFEILSSTLISIIGAVALFYLYAKYKQTYWSKRGIYSPPCHWLFGHFTDAFLMRKSFPQAFGDLHNSIVDVDAPVVGVYVLQKPFLLLRDPGVIKHALIKDFHVFGNRYFAAKRETDVIGCKNLFSIENPQWRYIRSKLSPAFTSGKLKKYFPLVLASAVNMKSYLRSRVIGEEKVTVECRQLCDKYTTDVIVNFAFGVRTNSFAKAESELYLRTRKLFELDLLRAIQIFATFFYPTISDYLGGSMLDKSNDYFRRIFWESMNEKEKTGIKVGDIIDLLIDLKNEKLSSEFVFEGDYLVAQSAILLLAGIETSAVTISFTLLELAKHPEIQERARQEIRDKLSDHELTYETVLEMTYLNQVLSETLRMYPPAPLIDRVASQDYKIPGTDLTIDKGTAVYVTLMGLHQDPRYHSNPSEYNPDRFSAEQKTNITPFTYMPFGEGPRICIGMRIGQTQTLTGLATILNEYKVSLNPEYKNKLSRRSMLLVPEDGIRLYFKKL